MSTVLFQSQSSPPQFWGCVGGKGEHEGDRGEEGRVWGREREESVDEKRGDKGGNRWGKRRKDREEGEDSMD